MCLRTLDTATRMNVKEIKAPKHVHSNLGGYRLLEQ